MKEAANKGSISICKFLHEKDIPFYINNDGSRKGKESPLSIACSGKLNTVKYLISNLSNTIHSIPLSDSIISAASSGNFEIIKILQKINGERNNKPALFCAIDKGCECTKAVLEYFDDINITNNEGETPLYLACKYAKTKMVRLLLEKEGDISKLNYVDSNPIFVACVTNSNITKLLIEKGANIDVRNGNNIPSYFII